MCGIFAIYGNGKTENKDKFSNNRELYLRCSKLLRHRGPDWNGIHIEKNSVICHERLSIIDVDHGAQPLVTRESDGKPEFILSVNGEIYNHQGLKDIVLQGRHDFMTGSDCEVILYLYKEFREQFLNMLDGVFCFFLYDNVSDDFLVARDPIGVNPLYYARNSDGEYCFASEFKAIREWDSECKIEMFPPGHYMNKCKELVRYYRPKWMEYTMLRKNYDMSLDIVLKNVRETLIRATEKRLMADVPFGTLLSGGLDSSLTTSIACRILREQCGNKKWGNKLHTFSIGLKGAPDLKYAREVADFLGTEHHEYNFTVQEGVDAIRDVIYNLETYDITTVRASTPMYLMSRKIKATGIKMVLSGEGADEILGGYLYFHNAPSENEFHREVIKRVSNLHYFDCLRANKSTMAWGVEVRVPFLDKQFLECAVPIKQDYKLKEIEKYVLRKAFDLFEEDGKTPMYLPKSVLWRQKEQFSDGVGYNWVDSLVKKTEENITDEELAMAKEKYPINTPMTKEALYYRNIYSKLFPNCDSVVEYWIPNTSWAGVKADPSGRAQNTHLEVSNDFS